MANDSSSILWAISTAAYLLPGLVGISRRHDLGSGLQILLLYVLLTIAANFLVTFFEIHHVGIEWIEFVWPPLQYDLLIGTYLFWIARPLIRSLFVVSIILFSLFALVGLMIAEEIGQFNSLLRFVAAVLLVPASAYVLFVTHKAVHSSSGQHPAIWAASGSLIYFGGMSILFVISQWLSGDSFPMIHSTWMPVQSSLNIIFSGLLSVAFLNARSSKFPA